MRPFMDYVQTAFYEQSRWDLDNTYSSLTETTRSLLFFDTPKGLRLNVSSLSSPNFATSYTIGNVGFVDGSLSYLYSSLPIKYRSKSFEIDLRDVIQGYRHVQELENPGKRWLKEREGRGVPLSKKDTLLYGRLYLPRSSLEALYLRRLSPSQFLRLACVSDSHLENGATVLATLQQDFGKFSTELLYSTDSALCGARGLYNFGPDPRKTPPDETPSEQLYGRFSAGAEVYYGLLNKSGGMSTGLRFTTLPRHSGFPYTMTVTLNPLMGNLSSTYAVKAGRNISLASQFDFNFYSYESDLRLGCEIWRPRLKPENVDWARKIIRQGWKRTTLRPDQDVSGVLKARWDQNWKIGILWEGKIKEFLFSLGVSVDFQRREQVFRAVGVELQYSS